MLLLLNGCDWFINLDKFGETRIMVFSCIFHFSYFHFFRLFISLAVSTSERQVSVLSLYFLSRRRYVAQVGRHVHGAVPTYLHNTPATFAYR